MKDASLVTLVLTLQFLRPLHRERLIADIYKGLRENGGLMLVEKVLGEDSHFNRLFIKHYYDNKRRNGYSEMEIAQKREALENVLIPYKLLENRELLLQAASATWTCISSGTTSAASSRSSDVMMLARIGDFLFRFRNLIFPLCLPLALLPGPPLFGNVLVAAALGFLIAAMGEAVRACTIGLQYIVRGGKDRRVYAKDLVTGGLYAHTRNPMYVGNMLILIGLAVASNSWTCVAVAIPFYAFVCAAIVAAEERYLQGRFGAGFDALSRRTAMVAAIAGNPSHACGTQL